jgi:phosphoenolpyruvate carboxylase
MSDEYDAWKAVVHEWRSLDGMPDMNSAEATPLVRAIEAWGERLVQLRLRQSSDEVERALADNTGKYRLVSTPVKEGA